MNNTLTVFWYATWNAWRSGWLADFDFSKKYHYRKQMASVPFDKFVKTNVVMNSIINELLTIDSILPNEFLISWDGRKTPHFILTSHRLWMYDSQIKKHICTDILDIVDSHLSEGFWAGEFTLHLRDKTIQTYQKISFAPNNEILMKAIEQRRIMSQEMIDEYPESMPLPVPTIADEPQIPKEDKIPKELVTFMCRQCESALVWGQERCHKCNEPVISGLPIWLDSTLGFVITGILYLVVFIIVSLVAAALDLELSMPIRGVITVVLVHWHIGLPTSLRIYPRIARLKISYRVSEQDNFDDHESLEFNAKKERWESSSHNPYVLDTFNWGLNPEDAAVLLRVFPQNVAVTRLLKLSKHEKAAVRKAAIDSMGELGGRILADRVKNMASNDVDEDVRKIAKEVYDMLTTPSPDEDSSE